MTDTELFAQGEEMLAKDQSENIRLGERVKKLPDPNPPITIRIMPSLIERLDRLATAQRDCDGKNSISTIICRPCSNAWDSRAASCSSFREPSAARGDRFHEAEPRKGRPKP
jgi:hypothetical protein